jgi:hypothetical protein
MMSDFGGPGRVAAIQQFRQARRKAELKSLLSKLTGRQDDLLVFDEIRKTLDLTHPKPEELKNIPLDSIIGSVNRYYDFNRQFYPLDDSDEDRWAKVKELVEIKGLDPIEVYQVGEVYFVLDGNHRVSVARQMDAETIQAYVKEFRTEIQVKPEDEVIDVVLRLEHKELMEDTKLDLVRPEVEFKVTVCGRYKEIREHIAVHRYYLGLEQERDVPIEEAAASWVDNYYLPAVNVIRELNVLSDFSSRTETDLYLWLKKHQWELEQSLEKEIPDGDAALDLSEKFGKQFWRKVLRLWARLFHKDAKP